MFDGPEHLNSKYEVTQRSYFGKTALEMACLLGRTKMLQLFANNEVNLDGLNENGKFKQVFILGVNFNFIVNYLFKYRSSCKFQ